MYSVATTCSTRVPDAYVLPIGNSNEFAIIYTHGQLQTNDQVSTVLIFVFCVNLPLSYMSEKIWQRKEDAKSGSLIAPAHGEH